MINPRKKYTLPSEVVALFDKEYKNYGKQGGDTITESVRLLSDKKGIAAQNTSKEATARKSAKKATSERRRVLEEYERGKKEYEKELALNKYSLLVENSPWWTKVSSDASRIPLAGLPFTLAKGLYSGMNWLAGNDSAAKYWWLDANNDATTLAIALGAIPAHMNPYTGAVYDTALLAPMFKEMDQRGVFQNPGRNMTGEDAAMIALSALPFGAKYSPLVRYAWLLAGNIADEAANAAVQSSVPWIRNNARGLLLSRAINESVGNGIQLPPRVVRTVEGGGTNGRIKLSLPSHTNSNPRQFIIEPQGDNKYYIHMKTWDGNHIPANLSSAEKNALFEAVYNELPEGAEILFPQSSSEYLGTRGTVAGLQRLSRDPRFEAGSPGTLLYWDDKTKLAKTYNGTSFIKKPLLSSTLYIIENSEPINIPTIGWKEASNIKPKLTKHLLGEEAVKMFKEYGGEPIPEGSINGDLIRKYVPEARERYGLVGNTNITDEEIALALYKHINSLSPTINPLTGEPLIGFRGDTRRYTELKERLSPEELLKGSGTMDNSLGNLFLGEFPHSYLLGIDRYLVTARPETDYITQRKVVLNPNSSATGANYINLETEFSNWEDLFNKNYFSYPIRRMIGRRGRDLGFIYKIKPEYTSTGVNDINAFMFKGNPRIASDEILVGNIGRAASSEPVKFNLMTEEIPLLNLADSEGLTYLWNGKEINVLEDYGNETGAARELMSEHYSNLLKDALKNNEGVLISEKVDLNNVHPFRDEHSHYTYIALPNFNIGGAKHILPYDLRIPRDWNDRNIYRSLSIPVSIGGGYTLYNILNDNNLLIQVQRNGGRILPPW